MSNIKKPPMTLEQRIERYIDKCPPAVSGDYGHNATYSMACRLYNGFALTTADTLRWLQYFNEKCQPKWSQVELERKVNEAGKAVHEKPRGHLIGDGNGSEFKKEDFKPLPITPKIDPALLIEGAVGGFQCSETDLFEASPIKPSDEWFRDGVLLVSSLFQPGEIVNFVTKFKMAETKDGSQKANPDGYGESVERDQLIADWSFNGMPNSSAGGWMRMNPVDGQGVSDANITAFRFCLIEFDKTPIELQFSFLAMIPLPISAILTSGGRSIHAWVRVDAPDFDGYKAAVGKIHELIRRFGIDKANKNASRLSRLVGVKRTIGCFGDPRQRLLYLNPNPEQKAIL